MNTYCSHLGLYAAVAVVSILIMGWLAVWRFKSHRDGALPSDPQIVRLLANLLVLALIVSGLFVLIILGRIESWQFLCY